MAISQLPPPVTSQSIRLSKCWRVVRKDGTVLRFTEHNASLKIFVLGMYETFTPNLGFHVTTKDDTNGVGSYEAIGAISTIIPLDDFLSGKYEEAVVQEFLVDWKYPWAGAYRVNKYWMGPPQLTDTTFTVPLEGVTRFMSPEKGKRIGKLCTYDLFDANTCKVAKVFGTFLWANVLIAGVGVGANKRIQFTTTTDDPIPDGLGDDVFQDGKATFTTGDNVDWVANIRSSTDTGSGSHEIFLYLPTPKDISVGDRVTLERGCDRRDETCDNVFNNIKNFGGEPEVPGVGVASNVERVKKKK